MVANLKLLSAFNIFQWYGEILVLLSILCYLAIFSIESSLKMFFDLYGTFPQMMSDALTYFTVFFMVGVILNLDKFATHCRISLEDYLEERK
jgi:hypothetical protein